MTPTRKRRLYATLVILAVLAGAAGVTVWSLQQNLLFFQSPAMLQEQAMPPGRTFRLGGLVKPMSVDREGSSLAVNFVVADGKGEVPVVFNGILPDLFREGKGVIAIGAMDESGTFVADEVLAKHDENYMPPEVADALEAAAHPAKKQ
jgi:cytochrome c-type biogenesis protein CcmE